MDIANKVAVVTGASSGIGRAVAQSLAKRGCKLVLVDINEKVKEVADEIENSIPCIGDS